MTKLSQAVKWGSVNRKTRMRAYHTQHLHTCPTVTAQATWRGTTRKRRPTGTLALALGRAILGHGLVVCACALCPSCQGPGRSTWWEETPLLLTLVNRCGDARCRHALCTAFCPRILNQLFKVHVHKEARWKMAGKPEPPEIAEEAEGSKGRWGGSLRPFTVTKCW